MASTPIINKINTQIDKINATFQNDLPLFIKKVKQDKNKQRPAANPPTIMLAKLIPLLRKTPVIGKAKVNIFFTVIYLKCLKDKKCKFNLFKRLRNG